MMKDSRHALNESRDASGRIAHPTLDVLLVPVPDRVDLRALRVMVLQGPSRYVCTEGAGPR